MFICNYKNTRQKLLKTVSKKHIISHCILVKIFRYVRVHSCIIFSTKNYSTGTARDIHFNTVYLENLPVQGNIKLVEGIV